MARVMAVALIAYGSVVVAAPQLLPTFSLGVDDLGGMLLRIYNGNDHERISLFFITAPVVAACSLLNERLICPSTLKGNRSSVGRA
jgi:hypothetical protein